MKWHKNWKRILKTYSFIGIAANLLTSLSIAGLSVLGVVGSEVAFPLLLTLAIVFGLFGFFGRFIDQQIDEGREG